MRQDINAGGGQVEIASEDMDGDGKKDLVFTRSGSSLVTLLRNISTTGSIAFENPVNLVLAGNPEGLALGDWDSDGSIDLAASIPGTSPNNQIIIYRNTNLSGTINPSLFIAGTNLTSGTTPNRIASADIDKDGKTDLLSVNAGSNSLSVFRNISTSGTISFLTRVDFTTGTNPSGGLAVADFDRDGKIDIVLTNFASNSFSVFRNTSNPGIINVSSFAARLDFSSGAGSGPIRLSVSDFDGDTKPDIAVMTTASNAIQLYRNTSPAVGTITFGTAVSYTHSATSPTQVASGDVDNDSHADLLYCDGSLNNFYTRRATAAYASVTPTGPTSFCSGLSLTLYASGGASYLWSTGATTPSIAVNTAGAYSVSVNGCTSTPVITEVLPLPNVAIVPSGPTQLCPGTTVTLNATPA
ncbi:MAG: VCBS repeat-containing protein [Bacteroidetes bacterium]|nr:VCBS repeat-containing protein [Bacteroidota bacterium]